MPISEPTAVDGGQSLAKRVFPVFPPELEREIFYLTAQTYRGVSTRLMIIASRVKTWMEPFVYKTIFLHGTGHAIRFLDALTDYRSPEFAKSHVKALCIHPSITTILTIRLLAACSGLEYLALWPGTHLQTDAANLSNLISSLPLTSLSFNLRSILPPSHSKSVLRDHPVFVNLTHLYIVNHWVLWKSSLGIEHLPLLTHVAFRFWSRGGVHAVLATILEESSKLRVLVLLADSAVISGAREYLEKQDIQDIRVVVLKHVADEWELTDRDSASMWQRGECIVRWRRRNRAGPFDFPPEFPFGSVEAPCKTTL